MSTPRTKRMFAGASADPAQRQITSFFSPQSTGDVIITESPRQPILPPNVQSNLLSVGMRVRKSVPEGYKTSGSSAFKLWTDDAVPSPTTKITSSRVASRELLPFCGINRVGGLDTQPDFSDYEDDVPSLYAVPGLTLSQESNDSVVVSEPSRKRFFDEDGDSDSLAPAEWSNARILAIPKSRAKKPLEVGDVGQENMTGNVDFDDADFLVLDQEKGMDMSC